jgi:hypothetical protein
VRRLAELLAELPDDSRLRAAIRGTSRDEVWTVDRELAAQTVELLSVAASRQHRLAKPITVPRPDYLTRAGAAPTGPSSKADIARFFGYRYRPDGVGG